MFFAYLKLFKKNFEVEDLITDLLSKTESIKKTT